MKTKRGEYIVLVSLLLLQIIIHILCGANKEYLHMDESYSFGLSSFKQVELSFDADFYNNWHDGGYYADYLTLDEWETDSFAAVYENQKNDVHPPLYYLFLRIAMSFSVGELSMWPGIVLNIIIYAVITIVSYMLLKKLFDGQPYKKEKSALIAFLASMTMSSLSTVVYIRMYALASLLILISNYLHIRMSEEGAKPKWLVPIAIVALLGSLTHYYFIFYIVMLFLYQSFRFYRKDDYKSFLKYFLSMFLAGISSLLIFPYSIKHMFFGYQGEGFMTKLSDASQFVLNGTNYLWKLNQYTFNYFLLVIAAVAAFVAYYRKYHRDRFKYDTTPTLQNDENLKSIMFPTIFYFLVVSVAAPWVELRYIMPICIPAFILVVYYFHRLLKSGIGDDRSNAVVAFLLAVIFIVAPFKYDLNPEFLYPERADIVEKIENDYNVPAVYFQDMDDERFLDDILLFAKLEKSYIVPNPKMSERLFADIFGEVDVSRGVLVFINNGQNNDRILRLSKKVTGSENVEWLTRLNACDVYYLN